VVSGNPRPGSRTTAFATLLAQAVVHHLGFDDPSAVDVIDLAALAAGTSPDEDRANALSRVQRARLLIVASPTYKGAYTGLLKSFLDLLPPAALSGVVAVPLMTAGAPGHSLAADVHLRPVLLELGAWTPTAAVVALEPDLADPEPLLSAWLLKSGQVLRALLPAEALASVGERA
jgi:FMN reductase